MSDALKLAADPRTEFGKGASRRARAAGQIPAVLYGHGAAPVHVLLPGHQTMMALKHANALLTIVIGKDENMAIAKDVQRDPVRQIIEHVDLLIVRKGEKLTVDVPVLRELLYWESDVMDSLLGPPGVPTDRIEDAVPLLVPDP